MSIFLIQCMESFQLDWNGIDVIDSLVFVQRRDGGGGGGGGGGGEGGMYFDVANLFAHCKCFIYFLHRPRQSTVD